MPCLAPAEPCPFCAEPMWKPRHEFFGPALAQDREHKLLVPIIAVFTQGAWNMLTKTSATNPGPHRGRMLDVWRQSQGNAGGGRLHVKELGRVDPVYPAFDVEPHLLRLWFPSDDDQQPADMPTAVPFIVESTKPPAAVAEPFVLSPDERERVESRLVAMRERYRLTVEVEREAEAEQPRAEKPHELAVLELSRDESAYTERVKVAGPATPAEDAEALGTRTGTLACDAVGDAMDRIKARAKLNGKPAEGGAA